MVDPVTVSVITHRFEAIVQEMGEAMLRTAYSQILNSSRDFSTAITDAEARLVAQAEHVPIHVGSMPWAVRAINEAFGDSIKPGDVYLLNDPYHGGNHLPDLTTFFPSSSTASSASGRSTAHTRATSAARHTAPTTRTPPRSGRKVCASPRSSSMTPALSVRTSCR